MTVTVRFFAGLREQTGIGERTLEVGHDETASRLWAQIVGSPLAPGVMVAINQEYADRDATVADGDEIAFFPPVTGG